MDAAFVSLQSFYPAVNIHAYPADDKCGSWAVPPGWLVKSGRLTGPNGKIIADYDEHPLRLFTYSPAFTGEVSLDELQKHIMSDPARPKSVPFHFRNQYRHWNANWGFCLTQEERDGLVPGTYKVEIDSEFVKSELKMASQVHRGEQDDSFLFVGHFDHPGMAGDGLIGCLAGHEAITRLAQQSTRLTYRMVSTVEIVGSVFYATRRAREDNVREALFCSLSGVDAPLKYARTAQEKATIDRVMAHILKHADEPAEEIGFQRGIGNDEVAFDVYGVGIPCGSLQRWPYEHYHTDADSADKVVAEKMESFVQILLRVIYVFENNSLLRGLFSGLPQLAHPDIDLYIGPGKVSRVVDDSNDASEELYKRLSRNELWGSPDLDPGELNQLMITIPSFADGKHSTLDIAEITDLPFSVVDAYTAMWQEKGLLEKSWLNPFGEEKDSE